jgi:heterodisulfide reductase subunit C
MEKINFDFKEKLDRIIGGEFHSYCFQCGACVGDCPVARYSEKFNPRIIMLKTIYGRHEELLSENSVIWECSNCFTCYERCPQDVRPVEVIMALKNLAKKKGTNPPVVQQMVNAVKQTGRTVVVTRTTQKIRAQLGLKPIEEAPVTEIEKILA